jgi:hypothetical protein
LGFFYWLVPRIASSLGLVLSVVRDVVGVGNWFHCDAAVKKKKILKIKNNT